MLNMSFLNEHFSRLKDVHFVRFSTTCDYPLTLYREIVKTLRILNKRNLHRIPTSGYRLCNVQQIGEHWRLTLNVACTGAAFAVRVFLRLAALRGSGYYFYINFRTPRKTLIDKEYRRYYTEFYEHSHLLQSQTKITMLEPYYWRVDTRDAEFCLLQFLNIFENRISSIFTHNVNGVEISTQSNIDPDDYFTSDCWQLDGRVRFFQPFGKFFNLLNR